MRVGHRFAASDPRYPRVIGYGATEDEAQRALEDKLPGRPPTAPRAQLLPLAPAHHMYARDRDERSDDALDRAIRVGSFEGNRRRH